MKSELVKLTQNQIISVEEDTQYVLQVPEAAIDKEYSVELLFEKPGVAAQIIAPYKLTGEQRFNLTTIANHKAPHTTCNTVIKGALYDHASSNYIGKIIIQKNAQQTSSYLDDAILVLGDQTKNSSQPILQIEADDVKASHGATTGRINTDQVYYLQSRGLTKDEAESFIVDGFFESLLSTITDEKVKKQVKSTLDDA